jgi:beta-glucanase (GH16 family)
MPFQSFIFHLAFKNKNMKNTKINRSLLGKYILLASLLIAFWSCDKNTDTGSHNWKLVWQDEFEGTKGQLPDATKWVFDIGTDWGNKQLEYDTNRAKNASLDGDGHLAITAMEESYSGCSYTSARINTKGLFEQKYGRFEARVKMPRGPGLWPAFWMLGTNYATTGWPQCGEIDIMEYKGQEPSIVHGTVHGPGYSAGNAITKSFSYSNDRFDTDYHVFAVEWTENNVDFFVDDKLYQHVTPNGVTGEWVYDHSFYIILNLAVGGNYVGYPTSQTSFPQSMLVDYVRVYKEVE